MISKNLGWLLATVFLLTVSIAEAQQGKKVPRIGFLRHGSPPDPLVDAFRDGLRGVGYVEGENMTIEYRWTEGKVERLGSFAAELADLKVDVIVSAGVFAARAARQATTTIPIVSLLSLTRSEKASSPVSRVPEATLRG